MKRVLHQLIIMVCILLGISGCAANKTYSIKDSKITKIKVAYYKTPKFQWNTTKGLPVLITFGMLGAEVAHALSPEIKVQPTDYCQTIMLKFVDKVKADIPKWPDMTIVEQPINEDHVDSDIILDIKVNRILYAFLVGLVSDTTATMKDNKGNILWQKNYLYKSSYFNRKKSLEEYEADNYKLLKEEMDYASNMTVKDFVEHLKGN